MRDNWLFLSLCVILLVYASDPSQVIKMALSDLQKLVENMKRAQTITARAAADADKHAVIMDNFEKRMNINHENMSKIEEYEKQMAQMDMGNGGPPLDASFPTSSAATVPPQADKPPQNGPIFDKATGKQL